MAKPVMMIKFLDIPKEKSEFVCRMQDKTIVEKIQYALQKINTKKIKGGIANKNMLGVNRRCS